MSQYSNLDSFYALTRQKSDFYTWLSLVQKKGRYVHSMHTYVNQRMCRVKLVAIDSPRYSLTISDVNVLLMLCHLVVNFVELLFLTFTEEFSTIWPWPKMNTIAKDICITIPSAVNDFGTFGT